MAGCFLVTLGFGISLFGFWEGLGFRLVCLLGYDCWGVLFVFKFSFGVFGLFAGLGLRVRLRCWFWILFDCLGGASVYYGVVIALY